MNYDYIRLAQPVKGAIMVNKTAIPSNAYRLILVVKPSDPERKLELEQVLLKSGGSIASRTLEEGYTHLVIDYPIPMLIMNTQEHPAQKVLNRFSNLIERWMLGARN